MSLLDDAKRLGSLFSEPDFRGPTGFFGDPPIRVNEAREIVSQIPRIVAALEAASALMDIDEHEPTMAFEEGGRRYYVFCGRMMREQGHSDDCPWQALVAAMRGDSP